MAETAILECTAVVLRGRRLEYFTIAWKALEGLAAVGATALFLRDVDQHHQSSPSVSFGVVIFGVMRDVAMDEPFPRAAGRPNYVIALAWTPVQ
jgi:hypothetical protein